MTENMFALDLAAQILLHKLALRLIADEEALEDAMATTSLNDRLALDVLNAADEVDALHTTLFQPAVFDSPVVAQA
jgi:hypothetical protein